MASGRRERIRTSDPFVPNEMRYQAALHAVSTAILDTQTTVSTSHKNCKEKNNPNYASTQATTMAGKYGRGREIRTPDILLPKQARYQTALYPVRRRTSYCF